MLLRWKGGDGFTDAGLRPAYRQNRRWYDLSSAFYPVVMSTAAAGGLAANHFDLHDDWAPLRFAAIALVSLVPFTLTAIAEEFGWHGYLTPRSMRSASAASPTMCSSVSCGVCGTSPISSTTGTSPTNRSGRSLLGC